MTGKGNIHWASGTIKILCLNLRFGLADDGPNGWTYRKELYPDLVSEFASDFYAFQEANDFQIEYLHELLDDFDMMGQRSPAPDYWQSNVIFYHQSWRCLDWQHFYLSETPEVPSQFKESKWPRQCTLGTFQKEDFQITVINTHFDFKAEVQKESALLILDRLRQWPFNTPSIVVGDFNAGPESSCIEVFTAEPGGFKSAFQPPTAGTYHEFTGVAQNGPIDWILYRGDLQCCDAQIITRSKKGLYPSDHFPLVATFNPKTA